MSAACRTILLPLERELVAPPKTGSHWLIVNGRVLPPVAELWNETFHHQQHRRGDYLALKSQGSTVTPQLPPKPDFSGALVLLDRSRLANEENIVNAWNRVSEGSSVIVAGDIKAGIRSLRKWAAAHAEVVGSLSKHHAIVFWMTKNGGVWKLPGFQKPLSYETAPGMFSADGPDLGSRLLVETFDNQISGKVADLGAGWGYLSSELIPQSNVQTIDLFEADYTSLEAAKKNVVPDQHIDVGFHWCDVVNENIAGSYDWVVMNPPFHNGTKANIDLGRGFIKTAATILNKGGQLLMVANTHLPYEQTLKKHFRSFRQVDQRDGFKILEAIR